MKIQLCCGAGGGEVEEHSNLIEKGQHIVNQEIFNDILNK